MSERDQDELSGAAGSGPATTPEQDMLNDIMDRSMARTSPPPAAEAEDGPVEEDVSHETIPSDPQDPPPPKNKPSSFYVYLAVLFGAAFLMLLLAYFVQQRNNDAVRDDLRLASASREELLASVQTLEKENRDLKLDNGLLTYEKGHYQDLYKKAQDESYALQGELGISENRANAATALSYLERFCAEQDYLMAAAVVEECDHLFNEHGPMHNYVSALLSPSTIGRYFHLRENVVLKRAQCMVVEQFHSQPDGESYTEKVRIVPSASRYSEEAVAAARRLWNVLRSYADTPEAAARMMEPFYDPELNELAQLNEQNFRPSTIALFQEVRDDLIRLGHLTQHEDGSVSLTYPPSELLLYGEEDRSSPPDGEQNDSPQ